MGFVFCTGIQNQLAVLTVRSRLGFVRAQGKMRFDLAPTYGGGREAVHSQTRLHFICGAQSLRASLSIIFDESSRELVQSACAW